MKRFAYYNIVTRTKREKVVDCAVGIEKYAHSRTYREVLPTII